MQMIDAAFAFEVVRWLSRKHGIRHLRLTGGEPLLYPRLLPLIEKLGDLGSLREITLTTNGQALVEKARALKAAGLARINVSLDTLDPARFARFTRGGDVARTLRGVEAAAAAGLAPVKINVVAQRGFNEDELAAIAEWGLSRGCVVRFLEVMPIGPLAHATEKHLVPEPEILERLAALFEVRPLPQTIGQPATEYAVIGAGLEGEIGVIASTTRPFCDCCRRLRLTSHGQLVPCVHDRSRVSLMPAWDGQNLDISMADSLLATAVAAKPEVGPRNQAITMMSLGG
jgi:cyclic pyranopterin phosphate synthase